MDRLLSAPVVDPLSGGQSRRTAAIDALRALACFLVVMSHAVYVAGFEPAPPDYTYHVWLVGQAGVVLFFVISGYLIGGPFLTALMQGRPAPSTRTYLLRRWARIVPGWWVAVTIAFLTIPLTGAVAATKGVVVAHVLLVFFYFPRYADVSQLGVGWTLCLEVAFYVAAPLLFYATRYLRQRPFTSDELALGLGAGWLLSIICGAFQDREAARLHGALHIVYAALDFRYFGLFAPGLLVAVGLARHFPSGRVGVIVQTLAARRGLALSLSGASLVAAFMCSRSSHPVIFKGSYPALSVTAGLLFLSVVGQPPAATALLRRAGQLGVLTYGLYLFHTVVAALLVHRFGQFVSFGDVPIASAALAWVGSGGALTVITLPLAVLSWLLIERPAIRWAARLSTRREPAHARYDAVAVNSLPVRVSSTPPTRSP